MASKDQFAELENRLDWNRRVEVELREISHDPHRGHPAPHEEIARRLEHIRIAVEHLNHAGLHDIAEHVAERAHAAEPMNRRTLW